MSYSVGSLFAGIGGICYGFKQAGCNIIWANEIDHAACKTYKHNFPGHTLINDDIHNIKKPKNFGQVDIITSGFPCQAFSVAGHRKGFQDHRGNLFYETARFIKDIRPKAFLLENVKNLKSHDNGRTIKIIEEEIRKLGYSFLPFVLNSKDYGNIPQNRARVYIVGFRSEAKWNTKYSPKKCSMNFKALDKIPLKREIKEFIDTSRQDKKYYFQNEHPYIKEGKLNNMISKNKIYQWRRVYMRENKEGLCPTLTANMGTGGHNVPLILDSYGKRKLTPIECVKLQGFPGEFSFPEDIADSQCYKQVGNSVVVPVIKRIAEEMIKVLDLKYL
jgi:DNA (cytosine-5)-methyltransferase 1